MDRKIEKAYSILRDANKDIDQLFFDHVFLGGLWWLGIALSTLPWILWILFRKKDSTDRLMHAAFSVMLISSLLNTVGVQYHLWMYKFEVLPVIPAYEPWDFTLLPVSAMFLLQFKPHMHPFIKALLFGGITAFIGDPLFQWIGLYDPVNWKSIYSFPIYFIIYLIAHYLSRRQKFAKLN